MRLPGRPTLSPLAIDVQPDQIRASQLARGKGGAWTVRAVASIRRSSEDELPNDQDLDSLREVLVRQAVVGHDVVLLAPPAQTRCELLDLPPRGPGVPIERLARAEVARLARLDGTPFELVCGEVPPPKRGGTGTAMLASALPESAVQPLVDRLRDAGLRVRAVVPSSLAAAALAAQHSGETRAAVVDLAWGHASISLIDAGTAIYHRQLPDDGLSLLCRGMAAEFGLQQPEALCALADVGLDGAGGVGASRLTRLIEAYAEALANELEASVEFAARRYPAWTPTRILLAGSGSSIKGLDRWLSERLEVEVAVGGITDATRRNDDARQAALAIGAAIVASERKREPLLLSSKAVVALRRARHVRLWGRTVVASACVAGVLGAALHLVSFGPTGPLTSRLETLREEQARVEREGAAVAADLSKAREAVGFVNGLVEQPDYAVVLGLVGPCLDARTVLREVTIEAPANTNTTPTPAAGARATPTSAVAPVALRQMRLHGVAPTPGSVSDLVARLRAVDVFANVQLVRTSRASDGRGVTFEVRCDVGAFAKGGAP